MIDLTRPSRALLGDAYDLSKILEWSIDFYDLDGNVKSLRWYDFDEQIQIVSLLVGAIRQAASLSRSNTRATAQTTQSAASQAGWSFGGMNNEYSVVVNQLITIA